jgi:hypothetical protein
VINLIAPVVAICFMVHLFEGLFRRARPTAAVRGHPASAR